MTDLKCYTVYDVKADSYLQPFFSPHDLAAQHTIYMAASDSDSLFHSYPLDYRLIRIGIYSPFTGTIAPETAFDLGSIVDCSRACRSSRRLSDYEVDKVSRETPSVVKELKTQLKRINDES